VASHPKLYLGNPLLVAGLFGHDRCGTNACRPHSSNDPAGSMMRHYQHRNTAISGIAV